jgi:Flp pilus assembly protein TadD/LysM repeat protein
MRIIVFVVLLSSTIIGVSQTSMHTVRKGESIYSISRLYGTTPRLIADINDFNLQTLKLDLDQKIKIPSKYYEVKATKKDISYLNHKIILGENYYMIARKYNLTVYDILKTNNIEGSSKPIAGNIIKIPVADNANMQISEQQTKVNKTEDDIKDRNLDYVHKISSIDVGFLRSKPYDRSIFIPVLEYKYLPIIVFYVIDTFKSKNAIKLKDVVVQKKKKTKYKFGDIVDTFTQQKSDFQLFLANKIIDKNHFTKGYKKLQKSLDLNPNNKASLLLCAELELTMGNTTLALEELNKVIILDSNNYVAYYNRSVANQRLGRADDAERDIEKAIKLNKKEVKNYIARGNIYLMQRKFQSAIDNFNFVMLFKKNVETVFINRGIAYSGLFDYDKAIVDFNEAIKLKNNNLNHTTTEVWPKS